MNMPSHVYFAHERYVKKLVKEYDELIVKDYELVKDYDELMTNMHICIYIYIYTYTYTHTYMSTGWICDEGAERG